MPRHIQRLSLCLLSQAVSTWYVEGEEGKKIYMYGNHIVKEKE